MSTAGGAQIQNGDLINQNGDSWDLELILLTILRLLSIKIATKQRNNMITMEELVKLPIQLVGDEFDGKSDG